MLKPLGKLTEYSHDLATGNVLRCKALPPDEELFDFIVVQILQDDGRAVALLVCSGYKAGYLYTWLPKESSPQEKEGFVLSSEWLKANWQNGGISNATWRMSMSLKTTHLKKYISKTI
ncbi:Imm45 family immunity protein [Delftia tsuruhatensis]|uniref:Imm45 family immunity protein n=1 Tax=Delftia tsuruhatensis TaxID=180282 RepID=UPI001F1585F4|nr:Imm45 family immunity protein [Delftia tsuruhatensis]